LFIVSYLLGAADFAVSVGIAWLDLTSFELGKPTLGLEADVVGPVGLRQDAEQGCVHLLGRQVGNGMQHDLDSLAGRAGHGHS
jgi:hypothetical protein